MQQSAEARFDQLDTNKDGKLTREEAARGGISDADFRAANPDRDGTLDKQEYLNLVKSRFQAANPDKDGTLSKQELNSPAGQNFLALLQVSH